MLSIDTIFHYILRPEHRQTLVEILAYLTRAGPSSSPRLAEALCRSQLHAAIFLWHLRRSGFVTPSYFANSPDTWWMITNAGRRHLQGIDKLDERAPFAPFE